MIATAKTNPTHFGLPFGHWSLDRLVEYINRDWGLASRARIGAFEPSTGLALTQCAPRRDSANYVALLWKAWSARGRREG